jgi:hypothetical protein
LFSYPKWSKRRKCCITTAFQRLLSLAVVLYGCEPWSLTLREEHRLRAFENRVLRIFGLERDEEDGSWRVGIG